MDRGQKETEKLLKEIEKRINAEYSQAQAQIEAELQDYLRRYEIKDETWRKWVKEGKKTQKEYQQWRMGQLAVGQRWADQREAIARDLTSSMDIAKSIVNGYKPSIYAVNHNFATYQIEHDAKIDTSYTLYSRETVERLVRDDPSILPAPGSKVSKAIAEGKAIRWNKQVLQSVMIQGILQGDSIPKLATRLSETVSDRDRKAAIRNARTAATATQNAGRVDAYKRAQSKGVDLEQMWLATLDNRTRHSHRWLDGEMRPVGEAFSNGCEYPGDPKGDPEEIYNCRCSLRGVVKGLERRSGQFRDSSAIGDMTYDEWRNAKAVSNPITLQEEKGEAIRQSYLAEYRRGGKIKVGTYDYAIKQDKNTTDALASTFLANQIPWVDVEQLTEKLTEKQIIEKVGGLDPTLGSCSSLTWAYMANKAGYDVVDFRGGKSLELFADREAFITFVKDNGIKHETATTYSDMMGAWKMLGTMKDGKEYVLRTGRHAAMVRRDGTGGFEYLELQTANANGYKPLKFTDLSTRFGGKALSYSGGQPAVTTNILVDAESMEQSDAFKAMLGYVNRVKI